MSAEGLGMTYYPDQDRPGAFIDAPDEGAVVDGADLDAPTEAIFSARFVDEQTGEPISGVQALLYNDTHTVGRGDSADDEGILTIDRLFGGAYELYVWSSSSGHIDDWVREESGEARVYEVVGETDNDTIDIALPRAGLLSGRVIDDDGQPVNGATIVVHGPDDAVFSETTDPYGDWSIGGLSAGDWSVEARYQAWCSSDPAFVTVYWEGAVNPDWQVPISLAPGEEVDAVDLEMPVDGDQDAMGDRWEERWGLDTTRDDSAEDPDADGTTNLEEYLLDTNPVEVAEGCGCKGNKAVALPLFGLVGLAARRRRRGTRARP